MGILTWLLVGLVAGVLASFVMKGGFGILGDIVLGIIGAFVGGWVFSFFSHQKVTGFNIMSILIAFVGACILIAVLRALAPHGRRRV